MSCVRPHTRTSPVDVVTALCPLFNAPHSPSNIATTTGTARHKHAAHTPASGRARHVHVTKRWHGDGCVYIIIRSCAQATQVPLTLNQHTICNSCSIVRHAVAAPQPGTMSYRGSRKTGAANARGIDVESGAVQADGNCSQVQAFSPTNGGVRQSLLYVNSITGSRAYDISLWCCTSQSYHN